jgi:DNA-binding response OmpR family regulator
VDARALVLDGRKVGLTRLEFGVMRHLVENVGRVIARDELLREVWDQPFGGSNVVDAVMRTLRKKLGERARTVETVKGHGYRFLGFDPPADPEADERR